MFAVDWASAAMTFLENIRAQFDSTYGKCDPAVEGDPRKYSLGWYTEGVFYGVKLGTQIGMQVSADDEKKAWSSTWNMGYSQGLHFAAFHCSNLRIGDNESAEARYGAELMRERIVDMLHAAAKGDDIRAEAKA